MTDDISSLSLSGRVVLLTVAHLSQEDETPVHTGEVIQTSTETLASIDADTLGKLSEAEVSRTLNRLEAEGLLEMANPNEISPVGKGRPGYSLTVGVETVRDALASDDVVSPLITRLEERDT